MVQYITIVRLLAAIGKCDDGKRLGSFAGAGALHCLLARRRVTGHVLADGPDLRQKVLVAEHGLVGHENDTANSGAPSANAKLLHRNEIRAIALPNPRRLSSTRLITDGGFLQPILSLVLRLICPPDGFRIEHWR